MSLFTTLIPTLARPPANSANPASDLGPTVKPVYEVNEAEHAFNVTVLLPGVAKDGLELTTADGEIRIVGRRGWQPPAGWTSLHRESAIAPFHLVLTHDNAIDAEKITAELRDGVLRASFPKAAAIKPRKIAVN